MLKRMNASVDDSFLLEKRHEHHHFYLLKTLKDLICESGRVVEIALGFTFFIPVDFHVRFEPWVKVATRYYVDLKPSFWHTQHSGHECFLVGYNISSHPVTIPAGDYLGYIYLEQGEKKGLELLL
jgi:hypothetical protein